MGLRGDANPAKRPEVRAKIAAKARGRLHSEEAKAKIRAAATRQSDSPTWKGEEAGYDAVHKWLRKYYPRTGICELCGRDVGTAWRTGTEYAYKDRDGELGKKKAFKRDRSCYAELCKKCHRKKDWLEWLDLGVTQSWWTERDARIRVRKQRAWLAEAENADG